ncbi:HAD-IIA family hydrolase [Pseudodesulfovibrio thermohalotolerans]|uniref:HAD-IIA family hydrolase n=1 Tax=Pseudodesulfovibrio thermohalotolerans TaxID=2880651 RepID=UPI002442A8E0|nr:HAD-IIA family hydrolase [Pseudodesulfovibrio thermohalotolerans]WFS60901.1 HAD-IIA family hydrolase [Pseudodesulfovibrio thermohalotolerans]
MKNNFSKYSTYIFDLDGCIHFGETVAPGASELVSLLKNQGKRIAFLSNNSTHSPRSMQDKLRGMGISVKREQIFLASTITGIHLLQRFGGTSVCVAGTKSLVREIESFGHTCIPIHSENACTIMLLGRDTAFSMDTLRHCARHVQQGAEFYSTNMDLYHPRDDGMREPETGSLAAAVEAVTGRKPQAVTKPEGYAFQHILDTLGVTPSECLMVGDTPATDIAGAIAAGIDACWLTNNATQYPDNLKEPRLVLPSTYALYQTVAQSHHQPL